MEQYIIVKGARQHNLKNIDVKIPKNKLVVITGPSGSGKSSLAFDTIYAEGQRRYVESLSAFARQFLGMQDKPDVDDISGLSPAISIEQKGISHNPRSTVGTVTEIYDYLRLLYGRAGTPYCHICGHEVHKYTVDEIVDLVLKRWPDRRLSILAPVIKRKKGEHKNLFLRLRQAGYARVRVDGQILWLEEDITLDKNRTHDIEVVIDRIRAQEAKRDRLSEAVEKSFELADGFVLLVIDEQEEELLTNKFVCPDCGISIPEVEPRLFSFNSPYGACPSCSGIGSYEYFSKDLAIDPERKVFEGAIIPWGKNHYMLRRLEALARTKGWDLNTPFKSLPQDVKDVIINGSNDRALMTYREHGEEFTYMGRYEGLIPWLERRWKETDSENVKEELARFRTEDICEACRGRRLRPEALAVRVAGYSIGDLVEMQVASLVNVIKKVNSQESQWNNVIRPVLEELSKRLSFLVDVGVGYLTLNRRADTLSGGESQRIHLATQIGSKLSGVLYVLDEPTIGLHPRDTDRLLRTIKSIKDLGNSIIVVEHDREVMLAADHIIELGPAAGEMGGNIVFEGSTEDIQNSNCLSALYLRGESSGVVFSPHNSRRKPKGFIKIYGAEENNLKSIDVTIPLGELVCISGVSGSGKSTLLYEIIFKGIKRLLDSDFRARVGKHRAIEGYSQLQNVVLIDQSPIGRTPRSNPATYTGVFTYIRELFSMLPEAKLRGYSMGRFSFNVRGGRCEACKGEGLVKVPMLFMPDAYVTCEVCKGKRYNRETLEVKFKGKNITDVLDMTVDEACEFFKDIPKIEKKLSVIKEAGLGYIRLGQPAPTLSGGEAQRVKLATELSKQFRGSTLYLLDEPTTGLHYTDVKKLLLLLHRLVDQGNTVVVIEHNLDFLVSCDHIIDLGPEGGDGGGYIIATGTPEDLAENKSSYTGRYIDAFLQDIRGGKYLVS
ncbi:MAG: excinuclease ABC subunit UvrA [Acetomicrobium flavidum]|uniref:UvrABC system protein A n=5 Tax=Acetomicrobium flavidum TaxID=49896 RepID=A0ABY1JB18_9BACT|nr:excinuclease ABC subunit UvrA [Acetomicrobium flavidum]SIN62921.1 Excinuclease ABC subunit A [Acetomicrobium flavidum]